MNETIELPWTMKINWFIWWLGLIFSLGLYYLLLDEFLKTKTFTPIYFIPISIGALILIFLPRSIKCSEEGVSITHFIGWSEMVLWKDIKEAQIGKIVQIYRGSPYTTNFLSIKTKSGKVIKINFQFFNLGDIPKLLRLLRANTVGADLEYSI